MPDEPEPLTYFTHDIGGRLFPGWYRRLPGRRIEVFTRTRVRIEFIEAESIETEARRILEELVRLDELPGSDSESPPHRSK